MVEPENAGQANPASLHSWLREEGPRLKRALAEGAALWLRGFHVEGAEGFGAVLDAFGVARKKYVGGNNPRKEINDKIYLSTLYPPSWEISQHSEMSHLRDWPSLIGFYCQVAPGAGQGGHTPLCGSEEVLRRIPPDLRAKFEAKGVLYVQRMPGDRDTFGFGRHWQEVFQTPDRAEVEVFCEKFGIETSWEGNLCEARFHRPALLKHPVSGKVVWFNQAEQWHYTNIEATTRALMVRKIGVRKLPHMSYWGDGTDFTDDELAAVRGAYEQSMQRVGWRQGDVLLIDNQALMHGREKFRGPREILVSMGNY
jgi:hypothetical protein